MARFVLAIPCRAHSPFPTFQQEPVSRLSCEQGGLELLALVPGQLVSVKDSFQQTGKGLWFFGEPGVWGLPIIQAIGREEDTKREWG